MTSYRNTLQIGSQTVPNGVLLAPMSGVTDVPFRRLAHRLGAGLVVPEMVASEELVRKRPDGEHYPTAAAFCPRVHRAIRVVQ